MNLEELILKIGQSYKIAAKSTKILVGYKMIYGYKRKGEENYGKRAKSYNRQDH